MWRKAQKKEHFQNCFGQRQGWWDQHVGSEGGFWGWLMWHCVFYCNAFLNIQEFTYFSATLQSWVCPFKAESKPRKEKQLWASKLAASWSLGCIKDAKPHPPQRGWQFSQGSSHSDHKDKRSHTVYMIFGKTDELNTCIHICLKTLSSEKWCILRTFKLILEAMVFFSFESSVWRFV